MAEQTEDTDEAQWIAELEGFAEDAGYFEPIGERHFVMFADRSTDLLVSFETVEAIRARGEDALPTGFELSEEEGGISSLSLVARGETWFRDPAVFGYFDRLADEGFFDDFDRVVFYGAGMCGYAAAAFSVAAPGATVFVIDPVATLDAAVANWDTRFVAHRRLNFTDRYGYAPEMIDAADRAYVMYDPTNRLDAMHAALFTRPNVVKVRARFTGVHGERILREEGLLLPFLRRAATQGITRMDAFRMVRAIRGNPRYLMRVLSVLKREERPYLTAHFAMAARARNDRPHFRHALEDALEALKASGRKLPPGAERTLAEAEAETAEPAPETGTG